MWGRLNSNFRTSHSRMMAYVVFCILLLWLHAQIILTTLTIHSPITGDRSCAMCHSLDSSAMPLETNYMGATKFKFHTSHSRKHM